MPSEKILAQKQAYVKELSEQLKGAMSGVVVSYKGINVADDTALRKKLREAGVTYNVVKNTMLLRAAQDAGLNELEEVLSGSTALATCNDYVTAAKILCEYADKSKTFEIKAGFIDGAVVSKEQVEALAKMPSKEVLLAQVLGGMNAPITSFVGVLHANLRSLVIALNAIAQKSA